MRCAPTKAPASVESGYSPERERMSDTEARRAEREPSPTRDRMVRLAIFLAAVVFVLLYVFVL
jgi:hypothetical protein